MARAGLGESSTRFSSAGSSQSRFSAPRKSDATRKSYRPSTPDTTQAERERFCIPDDDVLTLADYAIKIERHYSSTAARPVPMDMEWAKDGTDQQLCVVQARPETVTTNKHGNTLEQFVLKGSGKTLVVGRVVGARIGSGSVHVIPSAAHIADFTPGEILVTDNTPPEWEPIMKHAGGIVTNRGGRTCHAATVAREFGIPAVIGCEDATEKLRTGDTVTVSFAEGDVGKVYQGSIPFEIQRTDLTDLPRPRTKIMLILGNPEVAFPCSFLPNAGRLLRPASVRRHRNDRRGLLSEAGNRADVGLQDQ